MKLDLSVAIGDYDRVRPLIDESVQIDGVRPIFMLLSPEEIFFRAMRHADFDVCEVSLSSFALRTARGDNPYVGIPVFPSRTFRHTSIVVRTDRGINRPQDLKGRRVGTPEYQLTACVWARALLSDEYGVQPSDVAWVRGGMEQPGRVEKIDIDLPPNVRLETAPPGRTLSQLLDQGEIDGLIGPRLPSGFGRDSRLGWVFEDPRAAALEYYRRTGIFPIMHLLGVKRSLVERHPWLAAAILKAFDQAKAAALARLSDTSATKVTLPFLEETLLAVRREMGEDFWPYGLERNRNTLDTFLRHHYEQGLSSRRVAPEDLFHPSTLETFKI